MPLFPAMVMSLDGGTGVCSCQRVKNCNNFNLEINFAVFVSVINDFIIILVNQLWFYNVMIATVLEE